MAYAVCTNAPGAGLYRLQSAPSCVRIPGGDQGQDELYDQRPLQVCCLGVTSLLLERVQDGSIINS